MRRTDVAKCYNFIMTEIKTLLENYLNHLEVERNYSPKTRENYGRYLSEFIKSTEIKDVRAINAASIQDFRLFLARRKNSKGEFIQKTTQAYYVIAIRNFLKYLIKRDFRVLAPEKIELPKMAMRQIDILKYDDMERLLNAPAKACDLKSSRDKAILEMLFSTGLRISELCALDRHMDLKQGEIPVRGKGNKLRVVFVSNQARQYLQKYLDKRSDAEPALFISLAKTFSGKSPKVLGRITPRAVQRLVNFWSRKAGLGKRVTPHQLRHQFATDLLMNGADLRSVQELLGHQNISTTQVYTHITNPELHQVHLAFHGKRRK